MRRRRRRRTGDEKEEEKEEEKDKDEIGRRTSCRRDVKGDRERQRSRSERGTNNAYNKQTQVQ